ncbi:MAG: MFS transporter [Acidimicrobiia bacterium]
MRRSGSSTTDRPRLVSARFLAVCASTLVFYVGFGLNLPLIPRLIKDDLGYGSAVVGLVTSSTAISAVLCRPIVIRLIERKGLRTTLIVAAWFGAASLLLTAGFHSLGMLLVGRAFLGIAEAGYFIAAVAIIADLAEPSRRAEAASYFSVAMFLGLGLGPLVGEPMSHGDRFTIGFLIAAALCAVGAITAVAAPYVAYERRPKRALRDVFLNPRGVQAGAVLGMAIMAFSTYNLFIALRSDDIGFANAGVVFFTYSAVMFMARLFGAKVPERVGLVTCVAGAITLLGTGMFLIGALPNTLGLLGGTVIVALGMSLLYPSLQTMAIEGVDDSERTAVLASFTMFFELGTASGGVIFGLVAAGTSRAGAFMVSGVVAFSALPVLRRFARRRGQPDEAAVAAAGVAPAFDA